MNLAVFDINDYNVNTVALPPQVKTQYLQNIVDTSIEHWNSGQSITVVKGCMYIMFNVVDTAFSYWRVLIVC